MNARGEIQIDGRPVSIDPPTAKICVQVYENLDPDNQVRFATMRWEDFVELAWRLTLRPGNAVRT